MHQRPEAPLEGGVLPRWRDYHNTATSGSHSGSSGDAVLKRVRVADDRVMDTSQLQAARQASSGRSARTVFGGHEHVLRQTVIALLAGHALGDHENPGEATVHVLRGRVRLHSGDDAWDGRQGDLLLVPAAVHGLEATEDAVVLLTVAKHR